MEIQFNGRFPVIEVKRNVQQGFKGEATHTGNLCVDAQIMQKGALDDFNLEFQYDSVTQAHFSSKSILSGWNFIKINSVTVRFHP